MSEVIKIKAQDTWPLRHKVMWPDRTLDYVQLPEDDNGIHFGIFNEGALVSVISIFISGKEAQFRKLATDPEFQGRGLASLLLNHIIEYAKRSGIERIWCNARSDKAEFYTKFGLEITDHTFHKDGIDYVIMDYISDN